MGTRLPRIAPCQYVVEETYRKTTPHVAGAAYVKCRLPGAAVRGSGCRHVRQSELDFRGKQSVAWGQ